MRWTTGQDSGTDEWSDAARCGKVQPPDGRGGGKRLMAVMPGSNPGSELDLEPRKGSEAEKFIARTPNRHR